MLEEWERLIPELRASSFDAIAASMSITEKRRQLVSFTDRYYSNVVRFVARKGSGFDPANPAGKTIGASRATIASDWLEANLAGTATIRLYTGQQELHRDLAAGRLDAMFGDSLGSYAWLRGPEGAGFEFVGVEYRLDEGIGIAVRHEDASLLLRLNDALNSARCPERSNSFATRAVRYKPDRACAWYVLAGLLGSQTVRSPGRSPAQGYPRFSSCPACSCQANGREDRRLSR